MTVPIPRCAHCNGSVLGDACISCSRSVTPDLVSLGEALLGSAIPIHGDETRPHQAEVRQTVPVSVSLERVRLWSRGEDAP